MHKQSIADYILYNMNESRINNGFGINTSIISDVVEGWNRKIYITPNDGAKLRFPEKPDFSRYN